MQKLALTVLIMCVALVAVQAVAADASLSSPSTITINGDERGNSTTIDFVVTNDGNETVNNIILTNDIASRFNASITPTTIATMAVGATETISIDLDIPSDEDTSEQTLGSVTLTGDEASTSTSVTLANSSKLSIKDLTIKVGTKRDRDIQDGDTVDDEAEPGDEVTIEIEVENLFVDDDDEIQDIEVEITIENIDDGDDIDLDSSKFDLDGGDEEEIELSFTVPFLVDDESHSILINVKGEDENDIVHEVDWTVHLVVEKERHKVLLDRVSVSPSIVSCSAATTVDVRVVNVGEEDEEDLQVKVKNRALELDSERNFDLDSGSNDDTREILSFQIKVPTDTDAKVYPIDVALYLDGDLEDSEEIELTVRECDLTPPQDDGEPVVDDSGFEVVQDGQITIPPSTPTSSSFRNDVWYLVILGAVALILLIFVLWLAVK